MTHLENENTRLVPCTCHSRLNLKEINKTIYTVVYFYVPSLKGKHTFNHKDYLQIKKFTLSMCKVILQVGGGGMGSFAVILLAAVLMTFHISIALLCNG
jgi:hypothetical protein